jgi:NAD(P)-dependent dehydrogenase (short-subunit alcohol dehydrogenase family)
VDARVVPHEAWWVSHLARCEPGTLPFPEQGTATGDLASLPLDLSALPIVPGQAPADVALALAAGLLARLRGRAEFSVTYEGPELRALTQEVKGWYAGAVPARLSVPFDGALEALVESVARDLSEVRGRLTHASDLLLRSVVELTRAFVPGMRERKWGRVIGITSFAVKNPVPSLVLSNSLRAAVSGYLRTLADEIAAIAKRHGLFVVTRNTRDYSKTGVKVLNPFG